MCGTHIDPFRVLSVQFQMTYFISPPNFRLVLKLKRNGFTLKNNIGEKNVNNVIEDTQHGIRMESSVQNLCTNCAQNIKFY